MFTTAWWSATHARTRASLWLRGCACECGRVVRMDMQRVAVCWCAAAQRTASVARWASTLEHVFVGFSRPNRVHVRFLLALLIDLHA